MGDVVQSVCEISTFLLLSCCVVCCVFIKILLYPPDPPVIGCRDARPPPHAWYKRNGDLAQIGCDWSDAVWEITCENREWVGEIGNCSAQTPGKASVQVTLR